MYKKLSKPIRLAAFGTALLTCFVMTTSSWAAVRVCGERVKMAKMLTGKYQETPRAIGVSATGNSLLEIYTSMEGSWTVLLTTTRGVACIMGAGHSWQDKDQAHDRPRAKLAPGWEPAALVADSQ
ncbi:MAG: hypothetical protein GKR97_18715 [Rhizobiaceae bacterium]|nr:hypothetical protein [Rhizobiaceae bacterium]